MRFEDFAAGYEAELPDNFVHFGLQAEALYAARQWSYDIGRSTHALLRNEIDNPSTRMTDEKWRSYQEWTRGSGMVQMANDIDKLDDPARAESYNEVNFHCMNSDMFGMWIPLWYEKSWASSPNPNLRRDWIKSSQEGLARSGLLLYLLRERYIARRGGTESIYEKEDVIYKARTGAMQEIDAAIVLLDVMRRNPDITVVPAPLQFERGKRSNRNVDFLALHATQKTAVGIQVRSRLNSKDYVNADTERVVFLDGDTDLGNVRAVRVRQKSSQERIVPWPGIIAVKHFERVKSHGKGKNLRAARNPQRTLQEKIAAKNLVGNIDVDFSDLSTVIGQRIMQKLDET